MKSLQNIRSEIEEPRRRPPCGRVSEPIAVELQTFFGGLTAQPLPDRMLELAQALEDAFGRGELTPPAERRRPS